MIVFLDILSFLTNWICVFVFFWLLRTFLPLRSNRFLKVAAFFASSLISMVVIYVKDLYNIIGVLAGFLLYIFLFHKGRWLEKVMAVLVFYPAVVSVNLLMVNIGTRLFFDITGAGNPSEGWSNSVQLISNTFYLVSCLLRLLFWVFAWLILRKSLMQITEILTTRMLVIVNLLMLAFFITVFTVVCLGTDTPILQYPVCAASIFAAFGCIYLVAYLCSTTQLAYQAKELESQRNYYKDRIEDEKRVRSVYHDLKNHLLVLQGTLGIRECQKEFSEGLKQELQKELQTLQEEIGSYENYYQTGNLFLDILLKDKARAAREKQIDFQAAAELGDSDFLEPLDISTIFGNALDNAIEASEKLPDSMRLIDIKICKIHDMLVAVIENNCSVHSAAFPEKGGSQTTKTDTFLHGFGIRNMKSAVEKYGGQCTIKRDEGKYTVKIMIPMPEGAEEAFCQ